MSIELYLSKATGDQDYLWASFMDLSLKVLVDFEGQGVGLAFLGPLHHLVCVVGDVFAVRRDGVRVQVSPVAGERFTHDVRRELFLKKKLMK